MSFADHLAFPVESESKERVLARLRSGRKSSSCLLHPYTCRQTNSIPTLVARPERRGSSLRTKPESLAPAIPCAASPVASLARASDLSGKARDTSPSKHPAG